MIVFATSNELNLEDKLKCLYSGVSLRILYLNISHPYVWLQYRKLALFAFEFKISNDVVIKLVCLFGELGFCLTEKRLCHK